MGTMLRRVKRVQKIRHGFIHGFSERSFRALDSQPPASTRRQERKGMDPSPQALSPQKGRGRPGSACRRTGCASKPCTSKSERESPAGVSTADELGLTHLTKANNPCLGIHHTKRRQIGFDQKVAVQPEN